MRLRHRHEDDAWTDERTDEPQHGRPVTERADDRYSPATRSVRGDRDDLDERDRYERLDRPHDREETVETVGKDRWDIASLLAVAGGVALIVIGAVALVRAEIDSTWYDPVVQVLGANHTALLGAIEVGVGVLLVLAGLAGARMFAAFVALVAGVAAAIVAIEPDIVDRELALERGWATALAVAGIALALLLVMAPGRRVEHRIERRRPMAT